MGLEHPITVLWRRRLLFAATVVLCMAAVGAVTLALPRVYRATATVFVDAAGSDLSPDQLVHTYSTLAATPSVASQVRPSLPYETSTHDLLEKVSLRPIETSQLFEITAEASNARRAQTTANVYAGYFVRHVSAQVAQGELRQRISLAEVAALPRHAARPNARLSLGLGLLFSVFVAAAAVLLRQVLDRTVRVAPNDPSLMDVPIVGRIPRERRGTGARVDDAFRVLRLNLELQREPPPRLVAVTSPSADEGKSTVAAGLAFAAAADGQSAVILEGDLRRPQLSRALEPLGLAPRGAGLSEYLSGAATKPAIVTASGADVAVIFAGRPPADPTALLRSARMTALVQHLREGYDLVIIDTPPVPVGADASVLATMSDGVLVIVNVGRTRTSDLADGLDQLRAIKADLLGIAVNSAPVSDAAAAYYRGHSRARRGEQVGSGEEPTRA